ncbi:type VII secretion system-associated protein [Streptomyces viridiviolaceus]
MPDVAGTPEREEWPADVPESVREAAAAAPDHWFGVVDPAWRGEGTPPAWAVVGQYRSDADGEVVEWRYNDDYRLSPSASGWPDPTDPVDEAIQLAATGYGSRDEVFRLLGDAEVGVLLAPGGSPVEACSPDGNPVVPVFTSDLQLRSGGRYAARTVPVRDLVRELRDGTHLYVNPAGAVSMTVAPGELVTETAADQPAEAPPGEPGAPARGEGALAPSGAEPEPNAEPEPATAPESGAEPEPTTAPVPNGERDSGPGDVGRPPVTSTQEHLANILSGGAG